MTILNGPESVDALDPALTIARVRIAMTEIQIFYDGPIVKKANAKAQGLTRYFTGKPCKHGHIEERHIDGHCFECWRVKGSTYRVNNQEKTSERHRKYRAENRDKYLLRKKIYRDENKEKIKAYQIEYYQAYPEVAFRHKAERAARMMLADGNHTYEDVSEILDNQKGLCIYCEFDISLKYEIDHIMPIALGGSNWPSNLQCLCVKCNRSKGAKHPDDWHERIGRFDLIGLYG